MHRIGPVSLEAFLKKLRVLGFEGPYAGGRHFFMIKGDLRLTVPNPHKKEIGVDLLLKLLKQAGITREEWLDT